MPTLEKSMYGIELIIHGDNHASDEHPAVDHNSGPPAGPHGALALDTIAVPSYLDNLEDIGGSREIIGSGDLQSKPASFFIDMSATGADPRTMGSCYPNVTPYTNTFGLRGISAMEAQLTESHYQLLPISTHPSGSSFGRAPNASVVHTPARYKAVLDWMVQQAEVLPLYIDSIRV
ncbi:unnamed protein product [Rhizoctonia solani]|uniref:Uncharacterized protein n=1 Tax=Rhizoctonia solani TaxID=456999 RepID=A0A8H3DV51_9AGAM|nr:unnamed protein product [Rhizoctonia solani]